MNWHKNPFPYVLHSWFFDGENLRLSIFSPKRRQKENHSSKATTRNNNVLACKMCLRLKINALKSERIRLQFSTMSNMHVYLSPHIPQIDGQTDGQPDDFSYSFVAILYFYLGVSNSISCYDQHKQIKRIQAKQGHHPMCPRLTEKPFLWLLIFLRCSIKCLVLYILLIDFGLFSFGFFCYFK